MRGFQPAGDKTLKKKSTGPVRGPGTGTSDDVQAQVQDGTYIMPTDSTQAIGEQNLAAMGKGAPVDVNLSNGEFKMPPEQVHAVGVQALDQMKNATHTPVAARGLPAPAHQPGEPPLFFVDGGEVDKNKRTGPSPTNIFPQSSPAAGANIYSGVGFSADQFGSSGKLATVPDSIGQQPGRQQPAAPAVPVQAGMSDSQRDVAMSQIPTGGIASPARPAPAAPPGPAAARASGQPLDAQAASDRAKIGAAWDTVKGMNDDAGRAIADVAMMVPRGLAGAYDSAVVRPMRAAGFDASYLSPSLVPNGVDPSSMTPFTDQKRMQQQSAASVPAAPSATASVAPAAAAAQSTVAQPVEGGRGRINPPLANPTAPVPTSSQPTSTEIAPGVFRSGNSYSDSAAGAVAGTQARGLPSAQNMAAADALAQQSQQASTARVMAGQPVERGWSGVIGSDPGTSAAGRERRDLVASLTTPLKGAQNGQLTAAQRNGMLSLLDQEARGFQAKANNATALQQTEMQTNAQRDMTAMREAGDTGRAVLREAGESGRAGARNAVDQGRLGLEQQVRGFDIRAGQRQEKLHQRYEAAKTPEERSAIAQQIRDLAGKPAESPWKIQVTPSTKNADGSTTEGSIYRYNTQTSQVERVDTSKPQLPLDQNPQAAAIKANTALTREQRAAELRKLGY